MPVSKTYKLKRIYVKIYLKLYYKEYIKIIYIQYIQFFVNLVYSISDSLNIVQG